MMPHPNKGRIRDVLLSALGLAAIAVIVCAFYFVLYGDIFGGMV